MHPLLRPLLRPLFRPNGAFVFLLALAAIGVSCKPTGALPGPRLPATEPGGETRAEPPAELAPQTQQDVAQGAAPRLVVLVVVDQLPSWWFSTVTELLGGGVGRMLRQGVYYPDTRIPYAVTYTATGHAALGTGAPPAVTGIVANDWYRPKLGKRVSATHDPDSPVFVLAGQPAEVTTSSAVQLRVEGVADVLEQATSGHSKTIGISLKDRSAILTMGRRPDLAVWYEPAQPAMTTSRYYADEAPAWLRTLAREQPVASHFTGNWEPLPGVDHAARTGGPDAAPGEGDDFYGLDDTFPHSPAKTSNPAKALLATPAGDALVFETARMALAAEALGQDDVPDFLAVSFSAQDYAGHEWGQESWERLDMFLRFDDAMGALLDDLDQRIGRGRYAVVLTSDHGAARMVERVQAAGRPARRIPDSEIEEAARQAAARVLGKGDWIAAIGGFNVYMSQAFASLAPGRQDAALDAIISAISGIDGMDYAARIDGITGKCDQRAGLEALACRSVLPGASGQIFFTPASEFPITTYSAGTTHGSPSPDDRTVPVLVYAPGSERWAQPRVVREPVSFLQVAPTLSSILGVASPAAGAESPLP